MMKLSLRVSTLSLVIATTMGLVSQSFGQSNQAEIEQLTTDAFAEQSRQLQLFDLSDDALDQLDFARFLKRGLLTSPTNPIRMPALAEAIDLYQQVIAANIDRQTTATAQTELLSVLQRLDGAELTAELVELRTTLAAAQDSEINIGPAEEPRAPIGAKVEVNVADLRQQMADGSLDAALELLVFYTRFNAEQSELTRRQLLFLANAQFLTSPTAVARLARHYVETRDAAENPDVALGLLNLAAATGSDALIGSLTRFYEAVPGLSIEAARDIIWKLLASGSARAAEQIARDWIDGTQLFGFAKEEALWAVRLLQEVASPRADFLLAQLYYQGEHVPQDHRFAEQAMGRLVARTLASGERYLTTANRLSKIGLSDALTARYVLPLLLEARAGGEMAAIRPIARALLQGLRSGHYASVSALPLSAPRLVHDLTQAFEQGDNEAGRLLARIYYDGQLLEQDLAEAKRLYRYLVAGLDAEESTESEQQRRGFLERIARIDRALLPKSGDYAAYHEGLRALIDLNSTWAKREYGTLLIKGGPQVTKDEERGFALLLHAFQDGDIRAGTRAAAFATFVDDQLKMDQMAAAYAALPRTSLPPKEAVTFARLALALDDVVTARTLLSDPLVQQDAAAQFLRAKIDAALGHISKNEALTTMRRVIVEDQGDQEQVLAFILEIGREELSDDFIEPILERLASAAEAGLPAAAEAAFWFYQKYPNSHAVRFAKVVEWARSAAIQDEGALLSQIAELTPKDKVDTDDYGAFVESVETVLESVPTNGHLRVFLANHYNSREDFEKNQDKSRALLYDAAALGNQEALYELGQDLYYGRGVDKDQGRAVDVHRAVAYLGSNRSALAFARASSKDPTSRINETRAFAHYARAANAGSVAAMTDLGRSYIAGTSPTNNQETGLAWLKQAAALGNPDALVQLFYYYFVKDPSTDNKDALSWLDKLVSYNIRDMIFKKAVFLHNENEEKNEDEILSLLKQAEFLGSELARRFKNNLSEEK